MSPDTETFNAWVRSLLKDCSVYIENNIVGKESTIEEEDTMRRLYKIYALYFDDDKTTEPLTYAEKYG